uniref:EGF-like domain-containing protein n=1 Tax=Monopterus albus TaxID=43700 RepID=A0A3Q3II82_MONAL
MVLLHVFLCLTPGQNCEFLPCEAGNPCENGGVCVEDDSFTCICPPLWTGSVCNQSVSCAKNTSGKINAKSP